MRVCDYIAKRLSDKGIKQVYGLVGGGTSGLNDGFFSNDNIEFVCFHHEQGAGHAAVGAARTNRKLSVVNVTTGCGGTNVLTSCLDAWQESVPVLFLSGNTSLTNTAKYINETKSLSLRRYGLQEHNITETAKNLTKYAVFVESVEDVPYELEKAIYLAESGRPGPVWIDIPGNIQTAQLPETYREFFPEEQKKENKDLFKFSLEELLKAKRPVIVAGQGIVLSESNNQFKTFIDKYKIPFVTTFLTKDLIEYEHPQNIGLIGIKGNRAANFAMQNSDLLIILGCSMNVSHIGYDKKSFSPYSKKIMVDVDSSELFKGTFNIDYPINCSAKDFLEFFNGKEASYDIQDWNDKTSNWKSKWSIYDPSKHRSDEGGINLYELVECFNRNAKENDTIVVDAGQPCYVCSTNLKLKNNQRYMAQAAQGDMGYAIPASVGINKTDPNLNIILCIGEGSFYTNVQELAVIKEHNIPVKIFVINNDGYMSIKQTQDKFFGGRRFGVNKDTGVFFPDIKKIASAFEIDYHNISNNNEMDTSVAELLRKNYPVIIEVMSQDTLDVLPAQAIKPDGSQGGLHDMAPFLSEEELKAEMVVDL